MLGLLIISAAPASAAVADPVVRSNSAASDPQATAIESTEMATADAPLRYHASTCTGSALSTCGSGSHTAPICCQPGVRLSRMRRATTICARAS